MKGVYTRGGGWVYNRGKGCLPEAWGVHQSLGVYTRGRGCTTEGGCTPQHISIPEKTPSPPEPEAATKADSTHPTGMHSCLWPVLF